MSSVTVSSALHCRRLMRTLFTVVFSLSEALEKRLTGGTSTCSLCVHFLALRGSMSGPRGLEVLHFGSLYGEAV